MLLKGNFLQKCIVAAISFHEITFHISVSISSLRFHSYLGGPFNLIFQVQQLKKTGWTFLYFIFPFIMDLKKLLHFLHFKLTLTLLVIYLIIDILFESLVNDTFSNLKLNVFMITDCICSNKYVKKVILINHSWISPIFQRKWGLEFCLLFKKWGKVHFPPKRERMVK